MGENWDVELFLEAHTRRILQVMRTMRRMRVRMRMRSRSRIRIRIRMAKKYLGFHRMGMYTERERYMDGELILILYELICIMNCYTALYELRVERRGSGLAAQLQCTARL